MSIPATRNLLPSPRPRKRPDMTTKQEIVSYETAYTVRDGDCLLTTSQVLRKGYGIARLGRRTVPIHRMALEVKIGRDLVPGEQSNHTCHRPGCINPDHLYVGSHQENMRDRQRLGRQARGEANGQSKLTDDNVREIRLRHATGAISMLKLSFEYGVHNTIIRDVIMRKNWKHIL